jgi:NAD-dependent SIR2 family protein deacetylase
MKSITDFLLSKREADTLDRRIDRLRELLGGADAVLIGAGAGFSAAAGLEYSGPRFTGQFADFIERYGVQDMYGATFFDYPSEEERWAYWARHVLVNRYGDEGVELHRLLYELVADKPHFVITTNVDAVFAKAGFREEHIFAVQGDYGLNQCSVGCHETLYPNEALVRRMVAETRDCKVPAALVPRCPVCGGTMDVHVHKDQYFVQGAEWNLACDRYNEFLEQALRDGSLLLLELGVGYNTPGIIRYPFERIAARYRRTNLVRMNRDYPEAELLKERFLPFTEDIRTIFKRLKIHRGGEEF